MLEAGFALLPRPGAEFDESWTLPSGLRGTPPVPSPSSSVGLGASGGRRPPARRCAMRIRSVLVVAVALLLLGGTLSSPALAEPPHHAQVVHSVSGAAAYAPGSPWSGSFLFSAVVRADGTVSGRVVYEDGIVGDKADGIVTHVNVVGNRATVFAEPPRGFSARSAARGSSPLTSSSWWSRGLAASRIGWGGHCTSPTGSRLTGTCTPLRSHGHDSEGVHRLGGELGLLRSASSPDRGPRPGPLSPLRRRAIGSRSPLNLVQ